MREQASNQLDQSEPSTERQTSEVSQWSRKKTIFLSKTYFLRLELITEKLLELRLIAFMPELLISLIIPCA